MADYPYCTVPGKLSDFLKKIHQLGIPSKVTTRWLPTVGFASTNDRSILPILKFVGLIEVNGTPTDVWRSYRGPASGKALGAAIEEAYKEVYETYPDAHTRSGEELKAFFRGHSSYGAQALGKAVSTFQALCENAEFSGEARSARQQFPEDDAPQEYLSAAVPSASKSVAKAGPALHIDIQIHISPEASPGQIEKIFESMSKHLYK